MPVQSVSPRQRTVVPSAHLPRRSLAVRIAKQSLLLTAFTITLLGATSFLIVRALVTDRVLLQVSDAASVREDLLESVLQSEREHASLLAVREDVRGGAAASSAFLTQLLEDLRAGGVPAAGITLFEASGKQIIHVGIESPNPAKSPQSTMLIPAIDRKLGWIGNDVYVPILRADRRLQGILAVRYDMSQTLPPFFAAATLGDGAQIFLGRIENGKLFLLDQSAPEVFHTADLGDIGDPYVRDLGIARAAAGTEGVALLQSDRGQPVFAAFRFLPSLGWGMTVEVNATSALAGVTRLGLLIAGIGALLLGLAGALGSVLARQVTTPLSELSRKVSILGPRHWLFHRSVHTHDEVQLLDECVTDMAHRLKTLYEHLEKEVSSRTEELRRQYLLDRTILQSIEYGVIVIDAKGMVTDANPAASRLLQYDQEALTRMSGTQAIQFFERKKQAHTHPIDQVLKMRRTYRSHPSQHTSILCKDQSLLPVTLMIAPLVEGKSFIGAIAVFQDVTTERQIDYLKSEFISLASHQLRTPLSSIRWYTELLSSKGKPISPKDQQQYLAEIDTASQRMANLLESLLHVARLEGGGFTPEMQRVDVSAALRHMTDEWLLSAREKGFILSVSIPKQPLHIKTDPILLQIIVQNFLTNAIKYSPKMKHIDLRVEVQAHRVTIAVKDHGVGIPKDEQKRLFQKFFRARNVRTLDTDGSGLGLYMSHAIAENLGGKLSFTSEEGKGSTFRIVLPRKNGKSKQ